MSNRPDLLRAAHAVLEHVAGHTMIVSTFVILTAPGLVPEKKGPWSLQRHVADFLREMRRYLPTDTTITVVELTCHLDLWVQSAREWMQLVEDEPSTPPLQRTLQAMQRKGGNRTQARMAGRLVRIWSGEHGAYWRKDGAGYTDGRRIAAWVLPFEQAFERTKHCGPEKRIRFDEVR